MEEVFDRLREGAMKWGVGHSFTRHARSALWQSPPNVKKWIVQPFLGALIIVRVSRTSSRFYFGTILARQNGIFKVRCCPTEKLPAKST